MGLRLLILIFIWILAGWAELASSTLLQALDAVSSWRLALHTSPRETLPTFCQAAHEFHSKAATCHVSIEWREGNDYRSVCTETLLAADPRLRPPRYYRVRLACQLQMGQFHWSLPLLRTEIFR